MTWELDVVFWAGLFFAVVCLLACVLFLLVLAEDWCQRRAHGLPDPQPLVDISGPTSEEIAVAQAKYERHRDAESERMELIRRQLDENWEDEEDPRAESEADRALRELEERGEMSFEYERWLNTLPVAHPLDVAAKVDRRR